MKKPITFDRIARWSIGALLVALLWYGVTRFVGLVTYFVISLAFSYLLNPIVNQLESRGIKRVYAVSLAVGGVILMLVWASTTIIPLAAQQIRQLADSVNLETIRIIIRQVETAALNYFPVLESGALEDYVVRLADETVLTGSITTTVSGLVNALTNVFTGILIIPMATFFLLKDGYRIRRSLLESVPNAYFETTLVILDKIESRLITYFSSIGIQSFIVFALAWAGLHLIGLQNALAVAVAVGIANTIPYFGPIIGYALSLVVSIYETGDTALVPYALSVILVVQLVDNILLQPLIFSKSADLHPIYIIFVVLLGAEVAGVIGMLLAIPVTTVIRIVVTEIRWSFNQYHVFKLG